MEYLDPELTKRLETLAYNLTSPFCYTCYKEAPSGRCQTCASDDLMRLLSGVACDWNIDWVIAHLIAANVESFDTEEAFEQTVRECYSETTVVGWMTLDTVDTMKSSDSIWWKMAVQEWIDNEVTDGNLVTFDGGSTYVLTSEIEHYLDQEESKLEAAG